MDLLKRKGGEAEKKTKTARRATNIEATMTKKKATRVNLVDENLTLEKTKASVTDTVYIEERSLSYEFTEGIDQYHLQHDVFELTNNEYIKATRERPLAVMLSDIMLSARK